MYFGEDQSGDARCVEIKQLIAPSVPMWAEFEDPDGAHYLTGAKTRGNALPVVCLALVAELMEGKIDNYWVDGVEAMCVCEDSTCDPIFPASSMTDFCGLSLKPPILFEESAISK